MSAETLRRAAGLMRERAEAAASDYEPAPPRVEIDTDGTCDGCVEYGHLVASYPDPGNEPWLCPRCAARADYEASWHPAAALAVADLLDRAADDHDETPCPAIDAAFTLARAYLGAAS